MIEPRKPAPIGSPSVRRAGLSDVDRVAPLFDAYRQFYGQPPDLESARAFLIDRVRADESIVLMAIDGAGGAVGFAQLYRSFSSVSLRRILILNDLFVAERARRAGTGAALIAEAMAAGKSEGAARLTLATQISNIPAQALYERTGWKEQTAFKFYDLPLS